MENKTPHPAAWVPGRAAYERLASLFRQARALPGISGDVQVTEHVAGSGLGVGLVSAPASSGGNDLPFACRATGTGRWTVGPGVLQFWKTYLFRETTFFVGNRTGWIRIAMQAQCMDTGAEYAGSSYPFDVSVLTLSQSMEFVEVEEDEALVYHELVSGTVYNYYFYLIHFIDGAIEGQNYGGNQYEHPVTAPPT